jgi:hypothetical protein
MQLTATSKNCFTLFFIERGGEEVTRKKIGRELILKFIE